MGWVIDRAREPSTWRGVALILVAAGILPAGAVDLLVAAGVAVVGVVEVVRGE